jgi:hypothetical protein
MKIEDGYYSVGQPEYVGCFPIRQDIEVLPADITVRGWTIGRVVSINGNKYLRLLGKYLKRKGKTSEDQLSPEEIEKLYSKCEYK